MIFLFLKICQEILLATTSGALTGILLKVSLKVAIPEDFHGDLDILSGIFSDVSLEVQKFRNSECSLQILQKLLLEFLQRFHYTLFHILDNTFRHLFGNSAEKISR